MNNILEDLKEEINLNTKLFTKKLTPNLNLNTILGIKIPILRKYVNNLTKEEKLNFLESKSYYFEEKLIKGIILSNLKDSQLFIKYLNINLYILDSWPVTDIINPKALKNDLEVLNYSYKLIKSSLEYEKRLGIYLIMKLFLNNDNLDIIIDFISNNLSNDYYVEMMYAWLLCELYIINKELFFKYYNITNDNIKKYTKRKILDSKKVSNIDKNIIRSI